MQIVTFGPHSNALLFWGENAIVVLWLLFKTKTIIDAPQLRSPGGAAVCSAYRYSSQKVVSFSLIALSHSHTKKSSAPCVWRQKRKEQKRTPDYLWSSTTFFRQCAALPHVCKSKASKLGSFVGASVQREFVLISNSASLSIQNLSRQSMHV